MSSSQEGVTRSGTPRRTTRPATATPVRETSPPARNTRAASSALQNTPATRRSTRGASRRPNQPQDAVNNNVLPEIQTRQSYAYGSSKTPLLPEQLHVRDTLTMKQVADQMNTAITQAAQNLDAHAADLEQARKQAPMQARDGQINGRASKEPSPPASVTTEVQKKQRTAAWASSLDSGQLDDIEEEQSLVETPETKRTEPSSFPSGIFDQSYQYERGLRPPRRTPQPDRLSFGSRLGTWLGTLLDRAISSFSRLHELFVDFANGVGRWFAQVLHGISSTVLNLPYSRLFAVAVQTLLFVALAGCMSYAFCFGYTRYLCDPLSTSRVTQTLESWCGSCQSNHSQIGIPTTNSGIDMQKLRSALKNIDTQIRSIETRLNSRLDSKVSALYTDIDSLRREQTNLVQQIDHMSNRGSQQSSSDVASPLIPKINYFSPANGAIVNVQMTSPTRQAPMALPFRIITRLVWLQKYRAHNPVTALEPWQDVGDCWCAAAAGPGQDSIRLGVGVREYIYPTEIVVEHPPSDVSLTPETAPKHIELWADFAHLDATTRWNDLGLDSMVGTAMAGEDEVNPFGPTFGLIASVEYDLGTAGHHLQRFDLDVNQLGNLRLAARDFVVRVRTTYGASYGCLYRVRLHGVPVEKRDHQTLVVDVDVDNKQ